jgi:uncharacterized membrane protein YeaQ/YmgE (transglycosylase-associated protein family)
MKGTTVWTIKKIGVLRCAEFLGLIGFVWGFLAGIAILVSYLQGYLAEGDSALLQTGMSGFFLMIVYGVAGGVIGGAISAFLYNKVLGTRHGIQVDAESG